MINVHVEVVRNIKNAAEKQLKDQKEHDEYFRSCSFFYSLIIIQMTSIIS